VNGYKKLKPRRCVIPARTKFEACSTGWGGCLKEKYFYGYNIVAAGFVIQGVCIGSMFAYSVFFREFITEFGWSRTMISGASSLAFFLMIFSLSHNEPKKIRPVRIREHHENRDLRLFLPGDINYAFAFQKKP